MNSWVSFAARILPSRFASMSERKFTATMCKFFLSNSRRLCSSWRMKAIILAAGKGTRMRELTSELPKPMLRVQGKPILEHILEGLIAAGIREVFIVTGFRAEVIEEYFGDGSKWNVRIAYGRQVI